MSRLAPFVMVVLLAGITVARAELTPEEVGLLVMEQSPESRQIAAHYAQVRGVPVDNLLALPGAPDAELSRESWEQQLRPAIRQWLEERPRIRCLVATRGVPLKIGARPANAPVVQERGEFLRAARQRRIELYTQLLESLEALGGETPSQSPTLEPDVSVRKLTQQFEQELQAAQQRLQGVTDQAQRAAANTVFERVLIEAGGVRALARVGALKLGSGTPDAALMQKLQVIQGQLAGIQFGLQSLAALPDSVTRDLQMLRMLQAAGGLLAGLQWIDSELQLLQRNETYASFDSELALVNWPEYNLMRWQLNTLHYPVRAVSTELPPVVMVARLSAPTVEQARGLVDAAVAAEKKGLPGKVYLDARGLPYNAEKDQAGSYGQYDQSLRDLADRLKRHTDFAVVLDDQPALFSPESCPEAALYCGWYSLGKYVDAFTWTPGAIGYHMASMEAGTLTDPASALWCPAMLRDGVAVTLGPVHEPYLSAFPLPDDFFSLLLTGRHTLVETYYLTKPFNSWVMTLVGDPLYNPFKDKPRLTLEQLPERLRRALDQTAAAASVPELSNPTPALPGLPETLSPQ